MLLWINDLEWEIKSVKKTRNINIFYFFPQKEGLRNICRIYPATTSFYQIKKIVLLREIRSYFTKIKSIVYGSLECVSGKCKRTGL